ncbi:MAG: cobamide remodeling phosphodiesterase CbiR [Desulfobacterales bacterium]
MTESGSLKSPRPSLSQSYRNAYPFRLATTSFIYPDFMAPNVRMLAPFLDEIELLFFESTYPGSLPQPDEIRELVRLSESFGITYNVHLPLDISLTAAGAKERQQAVDTIKYCIDLADPLSPTTWTLHLPYGEEGAENFNHWRDRAQKSLAELCPSHIKGSLISIETLDYPLEWMADLLAAFDLSVCLDIGHMAVHGMDWIRFYENFTHKIPIIHLYGFQKAHEHLGLDQMPLDIRQGVSDILAQFAGTLCLEVFSFTRLKTSIQILSQLA